MKRNLGLIRRYYFWFVYSLASGHLGEGWKLLVKKTESASRPRHRICSMHQQASTPSLLKHALRAAPRGGFWARFSCLKLSWWGGRRTDDSCWHLLNIYCGPKQGVKCFTGTISRAHRSTLCYYIAQHFRKENADWEKLSDLPKITKRVGV